MLKRFSLVSILAAAGLLSGCTYPGALRGQSPSPAQSPTASVDLSARPSAAPSSTPPKLVPFEGTFVWDRPNAFGQVPTNLAEKGDEVCGALNQGEHYFRATGYHAAAADSKGIPFPGGGFYCELSREKPTQVVKAPSAPAPAAIARAPEPAPQSLQQPAVQVRPVEPPVATPRPAEPVRQAQAPAAPALELVQASMKVWQDSWRARDPITYLALFHPSFPGISQYSANRQKRMLAAKFIELSVDDPVYREEGDRVIVRFRQKYRSDTFRSDELKELVWLVRDQRPLIIEERFIRR